MSDLFFCSNCETWKKACVADIRLSLLSGAKRKINWAASFVCV